jgi:superfamily II DNA or RNA helicase
LPEVGQAVRVRNRLATVRAVEPYDSQGTAGRLHLVEVEYLDDCRYPEGDQLLWEVEVTAHIFGTTSLPHVDANRPDGPSALRAFVNAHRWTRLNRLREAEGIEGEPILGVWNSAIQVHPYQLEPVLRALEMPRVSLLLADGVGLGKTIQSGLVLEELLLRRRIRRVLVLCPAMLQRQWKDELRRKFNLDFEVIDSESTFQLRRRLGIDTNPWKAYPRVITSMDYLRMPDVLGQFLQASGAGPDATQQDGRSTPHAAWDLLIVDEAHHFAPQSGGRASQRTRMLREIRFLFEHRVFASATPHNGKTVCFTGLLELLDPIRFQMTVEMDVKDRENLAEVRIRRLKDDINRQSLRPPFAEQLPPVELKVGLTPKEADLYAALREYRIKGQKFFEDSTNSERWLGRFIFSLLTKRLLSCPLAFARTWWRHIEGGSDDESVSLFNMARVSAEKAEEQAKSDDEKSILEQDTAGYGGAWFRLKGTNLTTLQEKVGNALEALGFDRITVEDPTKLATLAKRSDSKTEALVAWVRKHLFVGGKLRDDERLIVFTEYKETLEYLAEKFRQEGFDDESMSLLYGGMKANEFEQVKSDFEDPANPVRLMLATDAASEGINMQESCRWIIHFDIPWSPSKLQQRNGRVSRHGQVREVSVHYFRCDQEEDMDFLFRIAEKVEQVREDLGSVERVLDSAIHRHFQGKKTSDEQLTLMLDDEIARSPERRELGQSSGDKIAALTRRAKELLESTDRRLGISPESLRDILLTALQVEGQGALEDIPGRPGFYRLKPPPRWAGMVKQSLTFGTRNDRMEIVFDTRHVTKDDHGPPVLRVKKHQVLMRLGHPVMRQAMATLTRQLHEPSGNDAIYRWALAALPRANFEALLVLHYTLTAVNQLREPLHDEVLSTVFRVEADGLVPVEESFQRSILQGELHPVRSTQRHAEWVRTFRSHWPRHKQSLESFRKQEEQRWFDVLQARATVTLDREKKAAKESYDYRIKELQERTREREINQLAKELVKQRAESEQPFLLEDLREEAKGSEQALLDQIELLKRDVEETRRSLTNERDYRLKLLLPRRFELREVRVLPLAIEYIVPSALGD